MGVGLALKRCAMPSSTRHGRGARAYALLRRQGDQNILFGVLPRLATARGRHEAAVRLVGYALRTRVRMGIADEGFAAWAEEGVPDTLTEDVACAPARRGRGAHRRSGLRARARGRGLKTPAGIGWRSRTRRKGARCSNRNRRRLAAGRAHPMACGSGGRRALPARRSRGARAARRVRFHAAVARARATGAGRAGDAVRT